MTGALTMIAKTCPALNHPTGVLYRTGNLLTREGEPLRVSRTRLRRMHTAGALQLPPSTVTPLTQPSVVPSLSGRGCWCTPAFPHNLITHTHATRTVGGPHQLAR